MNNHFKCLSVSTRLVFVPLVCCNVCTAREFFVSKAGGAFEHVKFVERDSCGVLVAKVVDKSRDNIVASL